MSAEIFKSITLQGCSEEEGKASASVVSTQIAIPLVLEWIITEFSTLDGKEKKSLLF